jgi:hypothetical protein
MERTHCKYGGGLTTKSYCGIFAQNKNCGGARETTVASKRLCNNIFFMQRFGKDFAAATDTHTTIKVLLETVFSTLSVQRGRIPPP